MVASTNLDEESERCLLGCILLEPSVFELDDVAAVDAEHFGNWSLRQIFRAVRQRHDDAEVIEAVAVARQLSELSESERIPLDSSPAILTSCMESVPHTGHADHYARQVRKAARRREAVRIGSELADSVRNGADLDSVLERIRNELADIHQPAKTTGPALVVRCLADVESRPVEWLWQDMVPLGKLALFCGDPGLGKSFVTCDLAARVSRGACWPDRSDPQPAGSVLILACEDDVEDTIRPRLDLAGADVSKVFFVESVRTRHRERGFTLEEDCELLRSEVERLGDVRLLVIDPISAYCGQVDTHRNSEVRSLLRPLTDMAAKYHLAVVGINHLTKSSGGKAVYRSTGSIAFVAAARAVWNFYKDPDDEERRLMLPTKMNLVKEPHGLAFRIEDSAVCWDDEPVYQSADDLQLVEGNRAESSDGSKLERAIEFLKLALADGPRPSNDLYETAERTGIKPRTLQRALKELRCKKSKDGMEGGWSWSLPPDS